MHSITYSKKYSYPANLNVEKKMRRKCKKKRTIDNKLKYYIIKFIFIYFKIEKLNNEEISRIKLFYSNPHLVDSNKFM